MLTLLNIVLVALGGALGSVARYLNVTLCQLIFGMAFPYGTLFVNTLGSFLIGFFMYLFVEKYMPHEMLRLFIVVGFMGGFTTFSSYAWETLALAQTNEWFLAALYVVLSNVFTLVMVSLGAYCSRYFI